MEIKKQLMKKVAVLMSLPFLAGCQTGAVSALGVGSLFGNSGGGDLGDGVLPLGEAAAIATVNNPEPASMLLMGGGMAAMAYFNKKKKNKTPRM